MTFFQFTLQCILKGNKPDFHSAMGAETSQVVFSNFIQELGKSYDPAKIQRELLQIY